MIEKIIPEFGGADSDTAADIAGCMREQMAEFLKKFENMSPEEIAEQRYQRFRKF